MKISGFIKSIVMSLLLLCLISCSSQTEKPVESAKLTEQQTNDLKKSQQHIQEWEEISPSLKRLVAIESELKSLISELNRVVSAEKNKTIVTEQEKEQSSQNTAVQPVMDNDNVIVSTPLSKASSNTAPLNKKDAELYSLQFASLANKNSLLPIWEKLQDKHPQLLDNLQPRYQKASLNGKTYYRLKSGEFHTKGLADELCKELSALGENCYITKGIGNKF
jgi:hypothetical protein